MSNLEDKLGEENARKLSALVGGTQITVPDNLTASVFNAGRLRERVGDGLFALLVFHFGGIRLYVPQLAQDRRTGQDRIDPKAVERLTRRGWSAARIARKLGCSNRTVYKCRAQTACNAGAT